MTEVTRVPLQPIRQGALTKLWLGIVIAILGAIGLAYATVPTSVNVETLRAGTGPTPSMQDVVLINYKGTLPDGKVFDQSEQAPMPVAGVISGFSKALQQMQRGGRYRIEIPSELAYGDQQSGPIPPNSDLTFEVELLDFRSQAEIEQQRRMMEQLQQMQGGAPGAPGVPAPPTLPGTPPPLPGAPPPQE